MLVHLVEQTKDLPQFRRTGIASKVAKVLSVSPKEFSCLPSSSSVFFSTLEYEVISPQAHGGIVGFQGRFHSDYVNY